MKIDGVLKSFLLLGGGVSYSSSHADDEICLRFLVHFPAAQQLSLSTAPTTKITTTIKTIAVNVFYKQFLAVSLHILCQIAKRQPIAKRGQLF